MSIIKDIFYGQIEMQDSYCGRQQYRQALKDLIDADLKLQQALSDKQRDLLDEAKRRGNILNDIIEYESFAEGFRLGVRMMLEVLCEDE